MIVSRCYHGLIQAYSSTNRILNELKSQGNIVVFRNLIAATDDAITLFANVDAIGEIIMQPIEDYIGDFNRGVTALKAVAPSIDSVNDFSKCATERLESHTDSNYGKSRACQSNIVQCLRFMGFFRVVRNSLHICHASGAVPCRNLKRVEMPRAWRDEGTARIK